MASDSEKDEYQQKFEHWGCQYEYTSEDEGPTGEKCGAKAQLDENFMCRNHTEFDNFAANMRCKYVYRSDDDAVQAGRKDVGDRCSRGEHSEDGRWVIKHGDFSRVGYCDAHSIDGPHSGPKKEAGRQGGLANKASRQMERLGDLHGPESITQHMREILSMYLKGQISDSQFAELRKFFKDFSSIWKEMEGMERIKELEEKMEEMQEQDQTRKRPWE